MMARRWDRIREAFERARSLDGEALQAFLSELRGEDAELAGEIEAMLGAGESSSPFFEAPTSAAGGGPAGSTQKPPGLEDYELLDEVGRGGMGIVYRARQRSLPREVAVKVLPKHLLLRERQIDRFKREAGTIARLTHPGIVSIYEVGEEKDAYFFAMELVEGRDLAAALLEAKTSSTSREALDDTALPSFESTDYCGAIARVVADAADALHFAHEHGVVHRDVKPRNILLGTEGDVKLVDFGLALDHHLGKITQTDDWGGTPSYMSPEQLRAAGMRVDHRTDIYSMGVVLYEMLTLRRPFEGATRNDIIDRILNHRPISVRSLNPKVPRDLETIVNTAMAPEPDRRYASAAILRDDLRRFINHEAILAKPPTRRERATRWVRRHRVQLGVAGVILLVALTTWWVTSARAARQRYQNAVQRLSAALEPTSPAEWSSAASALRAFQTEFPGHAPPEYTQLRDNLVLHRSRELERFDKLSRTFSSGGLQTHERFSALTTMFEIARDLGRVFPRDEEIAGLDPGALIQPMLTVSAFNASRVPVEARVTTRLIDPITCEPGPAVERGFTPLERVIEPGIYRVIVDFGGDEFREFPVQLGDNRMTASIVATLNFTREEVLEEMVEFEPTEYTWPLIPLDAPLAWAGRRTSIAGFYLDRCEVTNAQYRAFLEANPDQTRPAYWPDDYVGPDPAFDQLPVTGIPLRDAAAYAAWAGKRLPTFAEWMYAYGGITGEAAVLSGNVGGPPRLRGVGKEGRWADYVANVKDACAEDGSTPEGVRNMFGNVKEWTESVAVYLIDGVFIADTYERVLIGGAWDAVPNEDPQVAILSTLSQYGIGDRERTHSVGFRCARSAER